MKLAAQISIIVTAHNEGRLAHRTMQSVFKAAQFAETNGVETEIIIVLDTPDKNTTEYFAEQRNAQLRVVTVAYADPGISRNHGVNLASGKYIALLDADDMFGEAWISKAHHLAENCNNDVIFYPEYVISFEGKNLIARYQGSGRSTFSAADMLEYNCWNSVHIFTKRSVLLAHPFEQTPLTSGFGYEDWHWYCELLANGLEVRIVSETSVYYRIKKQGSRLSTHFQSQVLIPPTKLFAPSILAKLAKSPMPDKWGTKASPAASGASSRRRSLKELVSTVTDPIFHRYPRLYPWLINHLGQNTVTGKTRPSAFPDWLVAEWQEMHDIEPQLFPEQHLLQNIPFYTVPESRVGRVYLDLCEAYGDNVSHLFLLPWIKRGGADLEALNYIEALSTQASVRGITVITTENTDSPWASRLPSGVRLVEFGQRYAFLSADEQEKLLSRVILQLAPQIVHNVNCDLAYRLFLNYGKALSSVSRLFVCSFCEDITPEGKHVGYPFSYLPECFDCLQAVFSDNQRFLDRLCSLYAFEGEKLLVHYQPFRIQTRRPYQNRVASKKHLDVLWAGRFDRQKRPDLLAAIAGQCLNLPITFHVYGAALLDDDIYTPALKKLANVKLYGSYDGLPSLPAEKFDIFLYTSQWDGLPNILLEAMSMGLPIIASNVGGISELIQDGQTGYLITPFDDVEHFVERIKGLLRDRSALPAIVDNAYAILETRHSWDSFINNLARVPGYISPVINVMEADA